MKSIGIREFRDKASHYLASQEMLAVRRHGKLIGLYIPIQQSEDEEIRKALDCLGETVEKVLGQSDLDEESLSNGLNLSQPQ